jgi:hypothetical protein
MANFIPAMTFNYEQTLKDADLWHDTEYTITSGSCGSFVPYPNSNLKNEQVCYWDSKNSQLTWGPVDNKPAKIYCQYCHGRTFDDYRGHCIACGGERE